MREPAATLGPLPSATPIDRGHPLAHGLAHCWLARPPLDGGAALYNLAGLYHGSLVNSPAWVNRDGPCLMFASASSQYVNCGNVPELNSVARFTLVAWMKRNAANSICIVSKATDSNNRVAINLFNDGVAYFNAGAGANTYGTASGVNDALWHRIALVYDGSGAANSDRLKAYVDGVQKTLSYVGTIPAATATYTGPLEIGRLNTGSLFYSNGCIDDVRVYSRPWTAAEAKADFDDPLAILRRPTPWVYLLTAVAGGPDVRPLAATLYRRRRIG